MSHQIFSLFWGRLCDSGFKKYLNGGEHNQLCFVNINLLAPSISARQKLAMKLVQCNTVLDFRYLSVAKIYRRSVLFQKIIDVTKNMKSM